MIVTPNIIKEIPLPIVGGTDFGRFDYISGEKTYNMMISDDTLIPFPGYRKVAEIGGVGREVYGSAKYQHLIAVIDDGVYTITTNNSVSRIGSLQTSTGNVFIAENEKNQIGIVDGLKFYYFDYGNNTPLQTQDVDFLPTYLTYQDGYFIAADGNSNQWRLSSLDPPLTFPNDAQHVGSLQSKADLTCATVSFESQILVFGKTVIEFWKDTDYQLFPYQRNNYFNIDYGCLSNTSIAVNGGMIAWLAANEKSGPVIMVSDGGRPQQITEDGISHLLDNLKNPEDSFGYMFRIGGHLIYVLTLPSDNISLAYDFNVKKFYNLSDQNLNYHIAKRVAFLNNTYYFLSQNDGDLYELSADIMTYDGNEIPRIRVLPPFRMPNKSRFVAPYLNIDMEQGDASNERIIDLSLSKDGATSFGNAVRKTLNPLGKRPNRMRFFGLGSANDLTMQLRFYGKDKFVVKGGTMGVYQ